MRVRIAQLLVTKNVEQNKEKILNAINKSERDEWLVFPEGMLSGYYPGKNDYPNLINASQINQSMVDIQERVKDKGIHCIFGTALLENNKWYNTAIYLDSLGEKKIYKKVNLSIPDRKCFVAGNTLDVYEVEGIKFGIQLCRDNAFPEQWKVLMHQGAEVVFHINNAIKRSDTIRKCLLISRAYENQFYVVSVNNADKPQTLPSLVISPSGEIIFESKPQEESVSFVNINLSEVKTYYLNEERRDVVEVLYKR